ncbi:GNAT family N-acetyltransferase [Enterococcus diestrammenae]|uniref:GNAT family N-acetyltransferase n=1 Tax=Enterococcus diestrammenae TaxID=1155073 RepID=UPI00195CE4C8|nr:GNAT family N-acetyltransferase [Candidatus Enterococcus stercoravium]
MELQTIVYGTTAYKETLALRNRVMRQPLGLNIADEDFSKESQALILGAYEASQLLGVGVMSQQEDNWQAVDYLCVDPEIQSRGVGRQLLQKLEEMAQEAGARGVWLEARVSAQAFYEKLGYRAFGNIYQMAHAPVPHIKMDKRFE